jgi:phosphatidylglycerol lysyltransferase
MEINPAKLDSWVRRYGRSSSSYVLLEGPKSYFTSPRVDGFLAYQVSGGVALIAGDPVCSLDQAQLLIHDFKLATASPIGAYQVSPQMLEAFRREGFADVQIGKEAIFNLDKFSLAGGAMELVRAATNKARRAGLVVSEHHPFDPGAEQVNNELREISAEWLRGKGNHELGFVLGSPGLDQPSAKRYFIVRSDNWLGRIEGFIVCEPIYARRGYYLDVTRRRPNAIRGTMELLTSEVFRLLKEEGYQMASMGLAPLALLDDPDLEQHRLLKRLMQFVFEHVDLKYDFKLLYRYKAKYHPHAWEPRYFCFNQRRLSPSMLWAIIRVRNPVNVETLVGRKSFQEKIKTWKHAASFIVGLCWALLSSLS